MRLVDRLARSRFLPSRDVPRHEANYSVRLLASSFPFLCSSSVQYFINLNYL